MQTTAHPTLSAIVAMAEDGLIGKNNQLPWHLPADLQHFKSITTGHPILMGRKTYESIGRPLPNRMNIILTRSPSFAAPGCVVVTSIEDALRYAALQHKQEIFIIGGADLYKQLLPRIQRIYLTQVHHHFSGDVYFPVLNKNEWKEIECIHHAADEKNAYDYSFLILERR